MQSLVMGIHVHGFAEKLMIDSLTGKFCGKSNDNQFHDRSSDEQQVVNPSDSQFRGKPREGEPCGRFRDKSTDGQP
jgi:hypothetical protein